MRAIRFLKCKYDGSVKRNRTGTLVEVRGDWVVIFYEPRLHTHFKHGERVATDTNPHLFYLNTRLPLTALNYLDATGRMVTGRYVDAALPATFDGETARYVDLDLDIVAEAGQSPYVKDILDFEQQRARLAYPPAVVEAAWEGIRIGSELLAAEAFPFDGSAPALVERALAALGPPGNSA